MYGFLIGILLYVTYKAQEIIEIFGEDVMLCYVTIWNKVKHNTFL